MDWQPIETAPKKTPVWVYDPVLAEHDKSLQRMNDVPWPLGCRPATYRMGEWALMGVGGNIARHPTHWMPLPEPPQ